MSFLEGELSEEVTIEFINDFYFMELTTVLQLGLVLIVELDLLLFLSKSAFA